MLPCKWLCRCECGKEVKVTYTNLVTGHTKSCGCLYLSTRRVSKNKTHGLSKTLTYQRWTEMLTRCTNSSSTAYLRYGAKGIKVCKEWKTYINFEKDMGVCPSIKYTLDRKDNTKGYEPSNCRWATRKEQSANRTNCIYVEGKCLKHWCEEKGYEYKLVHARLRKGMPFEKAIETPVRKRNQCYT